MKFTNSLWESLITIDRLMIRNNWNTFIHCLCENSFLGHDDKQVAGQRYSRIGKTELADGFVALPGGPGTLECHFRRYIAHHLNAILH
ncbi:hypothetical protein [Oceanobacillus sp. FSL K6-0127]|uniref:hypothetical protein n=2 Tax=Oceanobacillus TaxID=182709 RepID=UPI0030EC633D